MSISVKKTLPAHFKMRAPKWLKALYTRYELLRVAIAQFFLPGKCYVQSMPNTATKMAMFPGLRDEIDSYNHDTSIAQKSLSMDGNRVIMLRNMLRVVADLPAGDYAELGTYRGISARLIFGNLAADSQLHCFDTFGGFTDADVNAETHNVKDRGIGGAFSDTSLQLAQQYILNGRPGEDRLFMHQGYFPDTVAGFEERSWRFVHLDPDLYKPTLEGIRYFYPRLVSGGVLLLHDYNSFFTGVRRAADEYFSSRGIVVLPLGDKAGTGVVLKPSVVAQAA